MEFQQHPHSHIIEIHRSGGGLERVQGPEVRDYLNDAKKSIGSYWVPNSTRIATGLTLAEEKIFMPIITGTAADDKTFNTAVRDWAVGIDTKVPAIGIKLEIGTETGEDSFIDLRTGKPNGNMPINVEDYVRWRHARGAYNVANSKVEAEGMQHVEFYVFDPEAVEKTNQNKRKDKDKAAKLYLSIIEDDAKMKEMTLLLGKDWRDFPKRDFDAQIKDFLHTQSTTAPADFISKGTAEDFSIRAQINEMLNTKVLIQLGNRYAFVDTQNKKTYLGNSLDETIDFFKHDDNEELIIAMNALHQVALEKPMDKVVRQTKLTPKQQISNI